MTKSAVTRPRQRRKIFLRSDMGWPPSPPHGDDKVSPTYFRRALFGAARPLFAGAVILKSSSFLPDFSAAASHSGFNPRPAHVSAVLSGLRYFGATGPRRPPRPPFTRNPFVARRSSLPSWSWTARRSSVTLELRAASTWFLSIDNLSIDIDLRFMMIHRWFALGLLTTRISGQSCILSAKV